MNSSSAKASRAHARAILRWWSGGGRVVVARWKQSSSRLKVWCAHARSPLTARCPSSVPEVPAPSIIDVSGPPGPPTRPPLRPGRGRRTTDFLRADRGPPRLKPHSTPLYRQNLLSTIWPLSQGGGGAPATWTAGGEARNALGARVSQGTRGELV